MRGKQGGTDSKDSRGERGEMTEKSRRAAVIRAGPLLGAGRRGKGIYEKGKSVNRRYPL